MPASRVEPMSILRPMCFCLGSFSRILAVAKKRRREQKSILYNALLPSFYASLRVGLGRVSLATLVSRLPKGRTEHFLSNVVPIAAYVTSTSG